MPSFGVEGEGEESMATGWLEASGAEESQVRSGKAGVQRARGQAGAVTAENPPLL